VTPPPPRGGFCVPSTAAAAIDYLKRSAACPGKLRHLHAALPNPTHGRSSHLVLVVAKGVRLLNNATPQTRRHERAHPPPPPARTAAVARIAPPAHPHPPTHTHSSRRPPLSRNIFCPQDLKRRAVAFPLPLTAT